MNDQEFRLGPPPRRITPEMEAYIKHNRMAWLFYFIWGMIGLTTFLPFFILSMAMPEQLPAFKWVSYGILILMAGTLFWWQDRKKKRKARYHKVFEYGHVVEALVHRVRMNYNYTLNGMPQTIIQLELSGERMELRTFDADVIECFPEQSLVKVLYERTVPGVVIPIDLIGRSRGGPGGLSGGRYRQVRA